METTLQTYVPPLARFLLAFIFLSSGLNKIFNFDGVTGYMASKGVTTGTGFLLAGAIVFLIVGGVSLILGYKARIGAALLMIFLIPVTLIFHAFWAVPAEQAQAETISFMKNVSIFGGLLMVLAFGSGGFSLDNRK